jgi:2-hydroxy-3-oxopropionate reductase
VTTDAFVGLGIMGAPTARDLRATGFDVVAVNRSRGEVERFVRDGGRGADSVSDAVSDADALVTMLPDSPDVVAAMREVFPAARTGTLVIDMSSTRPDVTRQLAEDARSRDCRMSTLRSTTASRPRSTPHCP